MSKSFFDTLRVNVSGDQLTGIRQKAEAAGINFYYDAKGVQISIDETVTDAELNDIAAVFGAGPVASAATSASIPAALQRETDYLTHPVFNSYRTESDMMRYIKRLENRDLSLMHSMISLGSCTMKLNAATEMIPVSWELFANIHPFAPVAQTAGYQKIIRELEQYLCEITGFEACSLQPNSGAQGEYAGLMIIRAYHQARNEGHRNIALIPSSAHGTNPASAVMAGMEVVVVACDERGNIDVADLKTKAVQYSANLACLMVTYPSTHGVFETAIHEVCEIIHQHGGNQATPAVSAAPWGSASILLISYAYIKMLGGQGVTDATKYAILNANYIKERLEGPYQILYTGEKGRSAHELIVDLRPFKSVVSAEDVAKRLMDYGFHAPTLSFPVAGTIMIEPTESESKAELDRFCDALLQIRREIDEIAEGKYPAEDNVLHNAPHTVEAVSGDNWDHPYSREKAAFPLPYLRQGWKFWATVGRIDQAYGDRNLVCVCPPIEEYMMAR